MTGLVDWAAGRARMVLAFIALSLIAGTLAGPPASGAEGPQAGPPPPPPGGYWELGEQREPEPKDGRQSLLVGAILTPLGLLRVGGAVSTIYVAQDGRCQTTLQANDDTCQSLRLWRTSTPTRWSRS